MVFGLTIIGSIAITIGKIVVQFSILISKFFDYPKQKIVIIFIIVLGKTMTGVVFKIIFFVSLVATIFLMSNNVLFYFVKLCLQYK